MPYNDLKVKNTMFEGKPLYRKMGQIFQPEIQNRIIYLQNTQKSKNIENDLWYFYPRSFFVQFDEKFKKQPKMAQNRDFSKKQLSKSQ